MNLKKLLLVCAVLPLFAGCRTTVMSTDGKMYYPFERKINYWETYMQKPLAEVHKGVVAGLKALEVKPITNQVDKVSATVDGIFADNMDFEVVLEAVAPGMTKVRIRCGITGDQQRTIILFKSFEKEL